MESSFDQEEQMQNFQHKKNSFAQSNPSWGQD